ncbi:MAG: alpha/beta hydrolase family protein [Pyrinomonadaceae bacterium]
MPVKTDNLKSRILGRDTAFRLLLPSDYGRSRRRYPVLYLLHGLFGNCDNWLDLTDAGECSSGLDLILVCPDARDSWYTDGDLADSEQFETFFFSELIPMLEGSYRIEPSRENRAIAGNSMGGYGALKFALKRPDLFAFTASMSGAFDAPWQSHSSPGTDWEIMHGSIMKVFGPRHCRKRSENDIFQILTGPDQKLPEIYFDCGSRDPFLEVNQNLDRFMNKIGIRHEYLEVEGGHDWAYWGGRIKFVIDKAVTVLGQSPVDRNTDAAS